MPQLPNLPSPPRVSVSGGIVGAAVVALVGVIVSAQSFFTIAQTHVAFLTRFGQVVTPASQPLGPGLHFKTPFIDTADQISITTDTFEMPEKKAFTRDTQEITLRVGVTYRVPPTAAYHLLYEIGKSGNIDIHNNIILLSNEVVREVLSKHAIGDIAGEGRESVVAEIKSKLSTVLAEIMRIDVAAVQINSLDFSPQYKEAINQATIARSKTISAQQELERAKVEAQTRVTQAQADADAQAARANGEARARVAQAQAEADGNLAKAKADAEGTRLRGAAEAEASVVKIKAFGTAEAYTKFIQAQATLNWKGDVPRLMAGGTGGATSMPLVVPLSGDLVK